MEKIKPCPFCGGEGWLKQDNLGGWYVRCINHDCDVAVFTCSKESTKEAIAAWNRREGGQR